MANTVGGRHCTIRTVWTQNGKNMRRGLKTNPLDPPGLRSPGVHLLVEFQPPCMRKPRTYAKDNAITDRSVEVIMAAHGFTCTRA